MRPATISYLYQLLAMSSLLKITASNISYHTILGGDNIVPMIQTREINTTCSLSQRQHFVVANLSHPNSSIQLPSSLYHHQYIIWIPSTHRINPPNQRTLKSTPKTSKKQRQSHQTQPQLNVLLPLLLLIRPNPPHLPPQRSQNQNRPSDLTAHRRPPTRFCPNMLAFPITDALYTTLAITNPQTDYHILTPAG